MTEDTNSLFYLCVIRPDFPSFSIRFVGSVTLVNGLYFDSCIRCSHCEHCHCGVSTVRTKSLSLEHHWHQPPPPLWAWRFNFDFWKSFNFSTTFVIFIHRHTPKQWVKHKRRKRLRHGDITPFESPTRICQLERERDPRILAKKSRLFQSLQRYARSQLHSFDRSWGAELIM